MSDHYLYDPDICDGNLCVGDCDSCHHADEIFLKMEQDDEMEQNAIIVFHLIDGSTIEIA